MPLVGFEPTISAGEQPQTYALDGAATGTGPVQYILVKNIRHLTGYRLPLFTFFLLNGISPA